MCHREIGLQQSSAKTPFLSWILCTARAETNPSEIAISVTVIPIIRGPSEGGSRKFGGAPLGLLAKGVLERSLSGGIEMSIGAELEAS